MSSAQIAVALQGGLEHAGLTYYEPGEEVRGTVQVSPDSDIRCNHLHVRLQWHTEGRGDRDEGKVASLDVYQGQLSARLPASYDFRFTLPREPWSYAGHYVTIVWEIAVEIDVSWSTNPRYSQPFVMVPRAAASQGSP